ncbi:cysteine-rich CWC family protein [Vibrio rarus]|uniref:cysteine-rich CWC family protein n=1 Tax=Vibrio rarus TaxID=413403 RepID=UPI0036F20A52
MNNNINEQRCPFCQELNACTAKSLMPCWCQNIHIPAELLQLLPTQFQGKSCICLSCITAYKANPETFSAKLSLKQQ